MDNLPTVSSLEEWTTCLRFATAPFFFAYFDELKAIWKKALFSRATTTLTSEIKYLWEN
jgi:hypothetical protein